MTVFATNIQDYCDNKSSLEKLDLKEERHWSLLLLLAVNIGAFK